MKRSVPTTKLVDIGPLDGALRLPMASRLKAKMKTPCDYCRKEIEDVNLIVGFKKGMLNMMFHEGCIDEHTRSLIVNAHDVDGVEE